VPRELPRPSAGNRRGTGCAPLAPRADRRSLGCAKPISCLAPLTVVVALSWPGRRWCDRAPDATASPPDAIHASSGRVPGPPASLGEAVRSPVLRSISGAPDVVRLSCRSCNLAPLLRDVGLGRLRRAADLRCWAWQARFSASLFASVTAWIGRPSFLPLRYVAAGAMLVMVSQSTSAPALVVCRPGVRRLLRRLRRQSRRPWPPTFRRPRSRLDHRPPLSGVAFGALLRSPGRGLTPSISSWFLYRRQCWPGAALCLVSFAVTLMSPEPSHLAGGPETQPGRPSAELSAIQGIACRIASSNARAD